MEERGEGGGEGRGRMSGEEVEGRVADMGSERK